jgi:hypothetical protein
MEGSGSASTDFVSIAGVVDGVAVVGGLLVILGVEDSRIDA